MWTPARSLLVAAAMAAGLAAVPASRAEDVGLSTERLQRIPQLVQRYIDDKQITGAVTVVTRKGRTAHFEATGLMDAESKAPMRKDGVFRMAAMTKPVIGVAILLMLEEGRLRLTDPSLASSPNSRTRRSPCRKAVRRRPHNLRWAIGSSRNYTVAAAREITVRDLIARTPPVSRAAAPAAAKASASRRARTSDNLAGYIPKLGAVPLDFQPGTMWRYSALAGIEVLGRIVEVISGQTLDQFLKQRIFDPLGMKDTGFGPTDANMPRVVTLYRKTPAGLERQETPAWLATKTLFSGGGGLWLTAEDYTQFAQMLVNGGELNGRRLFSPRTIDLMATNHVGQLFAESNQTGTRSGMGFGLTVEVVVDPIAANRRTSAGSFGWDGAFGTHFWADRKEQLAGIILIQQASNAQLSRDFENAVMQAVVD